MWAFLNQFFNALIYNGISWILGCNKNRSIFLWSPSVIPKAHSSLYIYGVHFFFFNRFSQIDGFIRIFSSKKVADLYARLAHWLPIPSVQLLEHTFCHSWIGVRIMPTRKQIFCMSKYKFEIRNLYDQNEKSSIFILP